MKNEVISKEEFSILKLCLIEISSGPYIDDIEFPTVTGFTKDDVVLLIGRWSEDNFDKQDIRMIGNCLNELTGFPHGMHQRLEGNINCSMENLISLQDKFYAVYKKLMPEVIILGNIDC